MGDITKQEEMEQLLEAILSSDGWLKLGKELGDPYSLSFNDRGYDSNYNPCDYSKVRGYVLSNITDQKLIDFCSANAQFVNQYTSFKGKYYSYHQGKLLAEGEWNSVRAALDELHHKHGQSVAALLEAIYSVTVEKGMKWDNYWAVQSLAKDLGAEKWQKPLSDLQLSGVVARHKGGIQLEKGLAPLIGQVIKEWRLQPEEQMAARSAPQPKGKGAQVEVDEISRAESEFESYLKEIVNNRLVQTVEFGKQFSISELGHYLERLFGPTLYFDSLLAIIQQYSLANAEIFTEAKKITMRTGFNLALFGEPGTGKTFATYRVICGDPNEGIPAHGIPGRNRYCGGMTPIKFIEIGEAYQGRTFNFIVTEFNDWFRDPGMVEPLKLAMERGQIRRETKREVIGPYRFDSFFSVNYNTRVREKGYADTVGDPNFNAIEDRMLCRLHRLTKTRFRDIADARRKVMLGILDEEKARQIRDHVTLVYAIQTGHKLVADRFERKSILITERFFNEIERAREAILKRLPSERMEFSPRLEQRAEQLACAASVIGYFKSSEKHIELDSEAIRLAIRFYIEEAAVRAQEAFDPAEVLKEIYPTTSSASSSGPIVSPVQTAPVQTPLSTEGDVGLLQSKIERLVASHDEAAIAFLTALLCGGGRVKKTFQYVFASYKHEWSELKFDEVKTKLVQEGIIQETENEISLNYPGHAQLGEQSWQELVNRLAQFVFDHSVGIYKELMKDIIPLQEYRYALSELAKVGPLLGEESISHISQAIGAKYWEAISKSLHRAGLLVWKASSKRHDYSSIFSPLVSVVKGTDAAVNNALAFIYVGQNIRSEGILQSDCSGYSSVIPVLEIFGLIRESTWYAHRLFLTTAEGTNRASNVLSHRLEAGRKDLTQMLQALPQRFVQFFIEELSSRPLPITQETRWGIAEVLGRVSHLCLLNNDQIMRLFEKARNAFEEKGLAVRAFDYVSTRGGELRELCSIFALEAKQFLAEYAGAKDFRSPLFSEELELKHRLFHFFHFIGDFTPGTGSIEALCEAAPKWGIDREEVRAAISYLKNKGAVAVDEDKQEYEIKLGGQHFYRRMVEESYFDPLVQYILQSG